MVLATLGKGFVWCEGGVEQAEMGQGMGPTICRTVTKLGALKRGEVKSQDFGLGELGSNLSCALQVG